MFSVMCETEEVTSELWDQAGSVTFGIETLSFPKTLFVVLPDKYEKHRIALCTASPAETITAKMLKKKKLKFNSINFFLQYLCTFDIYQCSISSGLSLSHKC